MDSSRSSLKTMGPLWGILTVYAHRSTFKSNVLVGMVKIYFSV